MLVYDNLKNDEKLFLIAGPCVIESREITFKIADKLKKITSELGINFVFKASYKKANRTSLDSYTGPGIDKGLQILSDIKNEFEVPILSDVHETSEIEFVKDVLDIIQIPAFLSRQTDLIIESAKSGKMVNIKKAQFMAPEDMESAVKKAVSTENKKLFVTERGTSFGYHNLVVDFRNFAVMKQLGYPVIYDVTHSLQKPSIGKTSGGNPELVPMMAKAALATGMVDGLFLETHPEPKNALSDAASMIALKDVKNMLSQAKKIYETIKEF